MRKSSTTLHQRFAAKVQPPDANGCWLWAGAKSGAGYGHIGVDGMTVSAHRVSWALVNGPVPDGLHVLHRCDVKRCVNPAHLFVGTNTDNVRDAINKGRFGHSRHVRGEKHPRAKLRAEDVYTIRAALAEGASQSSLARRFGVTSNAVNAIALGKSWRAR
jgi:hypothetical protein